MAMAIALFSTLLLAGFRKDACARPLLFTLVLLGLLATGPIAFALGPQLTKAYVAVLPLVMFALFPCFWWYHQVLISSVRLQWQGAAIKHCLSLFPASILSLSVWCLSAEEFSAIFFSDVTLPSFHAEATALAYFVAILAGCAMSLCYAISIFRHTLRYHRRLKDVFTNHSRKTLWWIEGVTGLLLFTWVYCLAVLAYDDRFAAYGLSENGVLMLLLLVVWTMAGFGLRQQPGFVELFEDTPAAAPSEAKEKYQRSALQRADFERIARKLSAAMEQDKVFLEPDLNLMGLAKHTGVSTQNLSQTLNQHLDTNFFDFVNAARVDAAKPMILAGQQTVLHIALEVGFNARSSFYKAFKHCTGMTPGEYKKHHA